MVKCSVCKEIKESSEFRKDKSRSNGLQSGCKKCRNKTTYPSQRIMKNIRTRLRNVIKGKSDTTSNLGCSGLELKRYLESLWKPGMSWDNYGYGPGKWVIDHIRPISNFLKMGDDVKAANHYTNLAPSWYEDNAAKSDKFDF